MISKAIENIYGGKVRVRVCGILSSENKYLLLNHTQLNEDNIFWNFPGGGLNQSETIHEALKREFIEETSLHIEVHEFMYLNEYISEKLHAVELYFKVSCSNLDIKLGFDPELNILDNWKWFTLKELDNLNPKHRPHFINALLS